jgi:hypothetical protein
MLQAADTGETLTAKREEWAMSDDTVPDGFARLPGFQRVANEQALRNHLDMQQARQRDRLRMALQLHQVASLPQSPEYRALVEAVRAWTPVPADGMGADPIPQSGEDEVFDLAMLDEPASKPANEALGRAIRQPQSMRVDVFTFDR